MSAKTAKASKVSKTAAKAPPVAAKPVAKPAAKSAAATLKSASKAKAVRPVTRSVAAKPKQSAAPKSRKGKPTTVQTVHDAPVPVTAKATKAAAKKSQAASKGETVFQRDAPLPIDVNAAKLLRELKKQNYDFHPSEGKGTFDGSKFDEFFTAEIETEVTRPAEIVHDRIARWRCQCCDAVIPVPRRTTVYHGDYILEHDDVLGLLVNGERWVPKAETPLEVVQPGRLKNPWTGDLIKAGKRSV